MRIRLRSGADIEKRLEMSSPSAFAPSARVGQPSGSFLGNRLKVESDLIVEAGVILQCVNRLNSDAKIFGKTGGAHVAAIYRGGGDQEALAEDVGRHNAVDKVIGIGALSNVDFGMCFLALSGRLTSDIVLKAARVGLPIVASLAAAIDSGIAIASDAKLTLVGFVRGKRMNIYTYANRILLEE